ncbi:hypothetical protein A2165_02860 [Candidatus Curtissbacteria bacterium RBG_13_40_7]|uniref:Uncharacterized protein n=1 Tax=Candidatus Curtissbacteria bacterium RBG_13_40_7 TaxID=1797706 RepID=A0A1F5FX04_9BACT|nr:MAG: hypothetical protein A2165_02860 [Candidatus Curtissbacteria bacterium RBG_13_40_7]
MSLNERISRRRLLGLGAAAVGLAAVGYGAKRLGFLGNDESQNETSALTGDKRTDLEPAKDYETAKSDFQKWYSDVQAFHTRLINEPEDPFIANCYATRLIIEGAQLLHDSDPNLQSPFVTVNEQTVTFGAIKLNLENPNQNNLAQVLTEALLRVDFEDDHVPPFSQNTFLDILPLIIRGVKLENNAVPFSLRPEELVKVAKTFEIMEDAGKPIPKTIRLVRDFQSQPAPEGVMNLVLENQFFNSRVRAVDSLAQFYLDQDPDLLGLYQATIDEAKADNLSEVTYPQLKGPHRESFTHLDDTRQIFYEAFSEYVFNPNDFRARILFAHAKGLEPEASLIVSHYDAISRHLFKGIQFIGYKGEVWNPQQYQPGYIVQIHDWDPTMPGFLVRPTPTMELDPSYPYVNKHSQVKILPDKPAIVPDDSTLTAEEMVRVQVGYLLSDGRFIFSDDEPNGWIPASALGQILQKPSNVSSNSRDFLTSLPSKRYITKSPKTVAV